MRIARVYTPQSLNMGQLLELEPAASKHLLTVLRLKPGASLVLFNGDGREFGARIEGATKNRASVSVGAQRPARTESPLRITLAQGISRGERMDYTLQKAVELGVSRIVPLLTERGMVRLDEKNAPRKLAHWQSVVIGACEQSGRLSVPQVAEPLALNRFLGQPGAALKLLLDPAAEPSLRMLARPIGHELLLLAGPEGGLSETERGNAQAAGFQGVRMGPRILRTETAGLVALSILQSQWGDLG
ncbi:MAG TPA: 16S rRNA (uracil(1498)-N(3))-methyltransferase [Gammaproteobacteria bacterium]|nr:16S rRNA (uracil(1498)-N(3))-methyltransferase [Gammaproteobacteria bacterium]